jgi:hypothetical protein
MRLGGSCIWVLVIGSMIETGGGKAVAKPSLLNKAPIKEFV